MRVYEYAKQRNLPAKEVLQALKNGGFEVESHMSVLSDQAAAYLDSLRASQAKASKSAIAPSTKNSSASVIDEKNKKVSHVQENDVAQTSSGAIPSAASSEEGIVIEPMMVSDFALRAKKPVAEIIIALLKQGVVAAKNQVIPEKVVASLVKLFGLSAKEEEQKKNLPTAGSARLALDGENVVERAPVVVVIGHVDHGKTTLLDFIRKSRVAAKEKGGITQHLGAYEATTAHGTLVFLDTPGHEAFTKMRERGTRVADIAVLVVAADDGVMPQTIEAIRQAQAAKLPLVVALNKIDKASPSQVEGVKRQLVQYNVVPEEWGGEAICIPVSAKYGTGVEQLLEVLVLQSKMMDLVARLDIPARGYVLEAKMEKGLGPVATVIIQNGILRVGDYFVAGSKAGKVVSLVDSWGKRVQSVRPTHPVQVAGFDGLAQAGDVFEVLPQSEIKKHKQGVTAVQPTMRSSRQESGLNIIIKVDNDSTREALLDALEKVNKKAYQAIHVVAAGIGAVSDSDVQLAIDTRSSVYTLHSKVEPSASALASKYNVVIKQFDIIYKFIEEVEALCQLGRPVKMITKKIGDAVVLKVFNIKNVGIIAGGQVSSGKLVKGAKVIVFRGKYKVGEGDIISLQRDKKTVKEVLSGFECALSVEGFDGWLVDDRIECYQEVPA